jgi:hypothetical protein
MTQAYIRRYVGTTATLDNGCCRNGGLMERKMEHLALFATANLAANTPGTDQCLWCPQSRTKPIRCPDQGHSLFESHSHTAL